MNFSPKTQKTDQNNAGLIKHTMRIIFLLIAILLIACDPPELPRVDLCDKLITAVYTQARVPTVYYRDQRDADEYGTLVEASLAADLYRQWEAAGFQPFYYHCDRPLHGPFSSVQTGKLGL